MNHIPADIAQVAAVVLGEERTKLTGWQRDDAIRAMTALGYSRHHIAWALRMTAVGLKEYSRRHHIRTHTHDQHFDWVAIDMVVTGTARIRLTGTDRDEAVRLMAPRFTAEEIAHRLFLGEAKEARNIADRLDLTLLEPERWSWQEYMSTGRGTKTWEKTRANLYPERSGWQLPHLDLDDAASKTEVIAGAIADAIRGGHLQPGELVPSINRIARRYRVRPATAVRVLRRLRDEGLVEASTPTGTRVARQAVAA